MNILDIAGKNDFMMCDDKTGQMLDVSQRVGAMETLKCIHELYAIIQQSQPKVHDFEVHFTLPALCKHFGWSAGDIAVIEQAAAASQLIGGQAPSR